MADFQQRLDEMVITVTSPDGRIKAKLVGGENLTVGFKPETYRQYTETDLAHQLARLGTLAWTGYQRGWLQLLGEANGKTYREEPVDWRPQHRAYEAELAELIFRGVSPGGQVEMKAKGLREWKVRIKAGTVGKLDEKAFIGEVEATFQRVLRDSRNQTILLKDEHFGLTIPAWLREKMRARLAARKVSPNAGTRLSHPV